MAEGLLEFYKRHDPDRDRVWICEARPGAALPTAARSDTTWSGAVHPGAALPAASRPGTARHGAAREAVMIGFMLLMHREGGAAQLRYFLIEPAYRGIGLGGRLMGLFMEHLRVRGYTSAYLWTTHELEAAAHLYTKAGFVLTEEKESTSFGKPLKERRYDLTVR